MKESCLFFFLLFTFLFPPYISFSFITLLHPFFPYCSFCFFLPSFAFLLPFLHSSLPLSYLLYLLSLLLLSLLPCLSFNQVVRMEKGVQGGETMQQGKFLKRLWKRKLKTGVGTHPLPWLVPGTANRENTGAKLYLHWAYPDRQGEDTEGMTREARSPRCASMAWLGMPLHLRSVLPLPAWAETELYLSCN